MARIPGTFGMSCRYSACGVNRVAIPRDHPSTNARDTVHKRQTRYPDTANRCHGRRWASPGPYRITASATTTANGVPGPTCGSQTAYSGAASAWTGTCRWLSTAPTATATATSAASPARAAQADLVCFLDADGSFDPAQLPRVVDPVRDRRADLVLGRRRPTVRRAWPVHARLGNAVLAARLRRATGAPLHDLGPMRAARRT